MSRWFRVYEDLIDDPKVQRLSPELFKALINIWCIASRNGGALPTVDDLAFSLRIKPEKVNKMLGELRQAGLLDDDVNGCHPHNWQARQFKSDVTDPTGAERQKRWRNAHRNGKSVTDTVTDKRPETETETETETEKKETRARCALAPDWPADYAEQFWQAYPNKIGRKDALRRLEAVGKSGKVSFLHLMAALLRYAAKTDDRPFCNPATWINQERWFDQPAKSNGKHSTGGISAAFDKLIAEATERERQADLGVEGQTVLRPGEGKGFDW